MQDEVKKYLQDILTAAEHILEFTSGIKSLDEYSKNLIVKRAVERELEIIGEALNSAMNLSGTLEITEARKIINTRNKIIHGYDKVEDAIIWAIILKHLPVLKMEVEKILKG
ncbi:MAG: DUF86 domain-containing protein [Bacteroidia bacterium]|nr:DUF86 domain-containing protein [Bacteroidia bacterium]